MERICEKTDATAIRVGARWLLILSMLERYDEFEAQQAKIVDKWPDSPLLPWLSACCMAPAGLDCMMFRPR